MSETITQASHLLGLNFTAAEKDSMIEGLTGNRKSYKALRNLKLDNSVPPALVFDPVPPRKTFNHQQEEIDWKVPHSVFMPDNKKVWRNIFRTSRFIPGGEIYRGQPRPLGGTA